MLAWIAFSGKPFTITQKSLSCAVIHRKKLLFAVLFASINTEIKMKKR